jgi:hypothetical protein
MIRDIMKEIKRLFFAAGLIALPLFFLFHDSLSPAKTLFANDASLGNLTTYTNTGSSQYLGAWGGLNWIGQAQPSAVPDISNGLYSLVGPTQYSKLLVPFSLLFLGLSAWIFCRCAGFSPVVGWITGVAAALAGNPVSYACWGLAPKALALGCILIALGGLTAARRTKSKVLGWLAFSGLTVGLSVSEGADVGALLSLYAGAYAGFGIFLGDSPLLKRVFGTFLSLAVVVLFAGWMASQSMSSLVGTQISGIAEVSKSPEAREQRWRFATGWSLPPEEAVRLVVPGIYGYRMDSPDGGAYWGRVGPDGSPASRFSGSGEYLGIPVVLIAVFGLTVAMRRRDSIFGVDDRKVMAFWAIAAGVSFLLALGHFAPFYRLIFDLPFFSSIRIPMKFLHGLNLAFWILFAYGLEGIARMYLSPSIAGGPSSVREALDGFSRRWLWGLGILGVVCLFLGITYAGNAGSLTLYLKSSVNFPMWEGEPASAAFSIREVWVAIGILAATGVVLALVLLKKVDSFNAWIAWGALFLITALDLVRADAPWVRYFDFKARYVSNPVFELLANHPWDHRVTAHLNPRRDGPFVLQQEFVYLEKEWLEHQFQLYRIQSLDIDQMPRTPELEAAYFSAFALDQQSDQRLKLATTYAPLRDKLPPDAASAVDGALAQPGAEGLLVARLWQLTNTRYFIGWKNSADYFNRACDPSKRRFRNVLPFALQMKAGAGSLRPNLPLPELVQWLDVRRDDAGQFAIFEFTGALPRAKLYTRWEVAADTAAQLGRLRDPAFDPEQAVVLERDPGIEKRSGEVEDAKVEITEYLAKRVRLKSHSSAASVLLLNDRWHSDWHVTVDGKPAELLRANFIMRGVRLESGDHIIEFRFEPTVWTLWVSLSAIGAGIILVVVLVVGGNGGEKRGSAGQSS